MDKKEIFEELSKIYCYTCHRCGKSALSQDECHRIADYRVICLPCWKKEAEWVIRFFSEENGVSGDYLPDLDKIRKLNALNKECPICEGSGVIMGEKDYDNNDIPIWNLETCPQCRGTGQIKKRRPK